MPEIGISNSYGFPVETVGELKQLLSPFTDECRITPHHVFYKEMNDGESAELIIKIDNQNR